MELDFTAIGKKWQTIWEERNCFQTKEDPSKEKFYVLDMFPYPSGAGLHVGHPLGYIASDIVSRYKRMLGFNVLHPMGFDAFGLPAEQYAIKTGKHPAKTTEENIQRYKQQLKAIGLSYDWSREVQTCDPNYYKWTQWAVVEMFNHWFDRTLGKARPISELEEIIAKQGTKGLDAAGSGSFELSANEWLRLDKRGREDVLSNYRLLYLSDMYVNWCPELGTVLANDEVKEGRSIRGNHPVVQKKMKQWMLRITAYAERLLTNLDQLDWPDAVVQMQRNWIGKSHGAEITFAIDGYDLGMKIFTTRPDTIFGCTFMVLAPEHELVDQITTSEQKEAIAAYRKEIEHLTERERMAGQRGVSGAFTGAFAKHPFNGKNIPIWISEYVLAEYGTGAIMAVPAHDERDEAFAKHFKLPMPQVIGDDGIAFNSEFLNGLNSEAAIARAIDEVEKRGLGRGVVNYRLRDATFSRQRFWGEPFPIYYVNGIPHTLTLDQLPLELPEIDDYRPTEKGEPPLARAASWQTADGHPFDLNTMPGFAGSSAYFLRYMDPKNDNALVSKEANRYWRNVDLYLGGREHATGHLIYSRFWNMFLFDIGLACEEEPFKKLINQGMITGRSSFVYRKKGGNVYVSKGLAKQHDAMAIHVDISLVKNDILDIDAFKAATPEARNAEFILEGGKYHCGYAIEKMSKSLYNVVNPDEIIEKYGADTLRLFEMFLGPLEQSKPWQDDNIEGVHRFLKRICSLVFDESGQVKLRDGSANLEELKAVHVMVQKIRKDIENLSFNTSISAAMIAVNALLKCEQPLHKETINILVRALAPFAPHLCEEIWSTALEEKGLIIDAAFPDYDEQYVQADLVAYPIMINGKKRHVMEFPTDATEAQIKEAALSDEQVKKYIDGKAIKKLVYVPNKIINIVV